MRGTRTSVSDRIYLLIPDVEASLSGLRAGHTLEHRIWLTVHERYSGTLLCLLDLLETDVSAGSISSG